MSSSGQAAWVKYFQGKGDTTTIVKKDSITYDSKNPNKAIGNIPAGTEIIFLNASKFDAKALISVKKENPPVRILFNNIAKPNVRSSIAPSLKPQAFGITGKALSFSAYKKLLLQNIEDRKDLSSEYKLYLGLLVDYWSRSNASSKKIIDIFSTVKDLISINDINKDFGEIIGPLAILSRNLFKNTFAKVDTTSLIEIPTRPNEPLVDYYIITKNNKINVSAKSGASTNTVKAKDILTLLESSKKITEFLNTAEYKVLSAISKNTVLKGPVEALKILLKTNENFEKWKTNNIYLKTKKLPTDIEIMYESEKYLSSESKTGYKLNFTDIFTKAIEDKVIYVKFKLNNTGEGEFNIITSNDLKEVSSGKRQFLRSKNGYSRASDQLGIQI